MSTVLIILRRVDYITASGISYGVELFLERREAPLDQVLDARLDRAARLEALEHAVREVLLPQRVQRRRVELEVDGQLAGVVELVELHRRLAQADGHRLELVLQRREVQVPPLRVHRHAHQIALIIAIDLLIGYWLLVIDYIDHYRFD